MSARPGCEITAAGRAFLFVLGGVMMDGSEIIRDIAVTLATALAPVLIGALIVLAKRYDSTIKTELEARNLGILYNIGRYFVLAMEEMYSKEPGSGEQKKAGAVALWSHELSSRGLKVPDQRVLSALTDAIVWEEINRPMWIEASPNEKAELEYKPVDTPRMLVGKG